ncbi:hypothetical protein [Streptomyces echinatus]|uniref:hypothetical protein n=1 Tax=Streptomyces echinatus TaxID=67293 RepID=UPI0037AFA717
MKTRMRRYAVAALLVGCCSLVSCGTQGADAARSAPSAPRTASAADGECFVEDAPQATEDDQGSSDTTSDDQGLPDTTSDDQGLPDTTSDDQELPDTTSDDQALPDTTSDDYQELPDTTTDDQELPDTTSDDQGPPEGDTTEDGVGVPDAGPHRWFSMTRDFRGYLKSGVPKADAAIAAHVERVCVRMPEAGGRTKAYVWADYGVWDDAQLDRVVRVFARWRLSGYGDHGHVTVLAPAKMTAEGSW